MRRDLLNAVAASTAFGAGVLLTGLGWTGVLLALVTMPAFAITSRTIRSFYTTDRLAIFLLSACVWAPFVVGTIAFGDWLTSAHPFPTSDMVEQEQPGGSLQRFEDPGGDCTVDADVQNSRSLRSVWVGVLDKKATFTPQVQYQPLFDYDSVVPVLVVIDPSGKVLWTQSLSGPPEYRLLARDAACRAKFMPSYVDGPPFVIDGILTFHFDAAKPGRITPLGEGRGVHQAR